MLKAPDARYFLLCDACILVTKIKEMLEEGKKWMNEHEQANQFIF